jgi:hypothetical protein
MMPPPVGVGVEPGVGLAVGVGVGVGEAPGLGEPVLPELSDGEGLALPPGEGEAPLAGGVAPGAAAWWPITPV